MHKWRLCLFAILSPQATQPHEFGKHLPPSLSAQRVGVPSEQGTALLICPFFHSRSCEGHAGLEQWPLMQDNISSPGSGDVATCVTKQFTIASCPASQMAL